MIHLSSLAHICRPLIRRAEAALTCRDRINFVFLNETAGATFHGDTYVLNFSVVSGLACLTSLMFG